MRREGVQRGVQEPAEPDAFAAAVFADAIHAVVPVAGADQRQAVLRPCTARLRAAAAVFEQVAVRSLTAGSKNASCSRAAAAGLR